LCYVDAPAKESAVKHLPLFLIIAAFFAAHPALADHVAGRIDSGSYSCRQFEADAAAPSRDGYAAATQYALVYLHVGVEVIGLPHLPITAEREATLLGHLRDLCRAEEDANFRLILARYLRSPTFLDWWAKLSV
jgi:hypothetical protein